MARRQIKLGHTFKQTSKQAKMRCGNATVQQKLAFSKSQKITVL